MYKKGPPVNSVHYIYQVLGSSINVAAVYIFITMGPFVNFAGVYIHYNGPVATHCLLWAVVALIART